MNPGKLDTLAQFHALRSDTVGASGAPRATFDSPRILWVGVDWDAARASLPVDNAGARREVVENHYIAHHDSAITPGSRLSVDGVAYEIVSVLPVKGRRQGYVSLLCRAIKGAKPVAP